jgi:hypothetical protein
VKVAGWEGEFRNFYNELLTSGERVSVYTYVWLFAILLFVVGVADGMGEMKAMEDYGSVPIQVLAFLGLSGVLPFLLSAIVSIEVARTIDTYVRDGVFNINIIRFIFTVVSLGLIGAGMIDIMFDALIRDNPVFVEEEGNVDYAKGAVWIVYGIGTALMGRLVFDIIRERDEATHKCCTYTINNPHGPFGIIHISFFFYKNWIISN